MTTDMPDLAAVAIMTENSSNEASLPSSSYSSAVSTAAADTTGVVIAATTSSDSGFQKGNNQHNSASDNNDNNLHTETKGVAGRTNYAVWDKVASQLVEEVEQEEEVEVQEGKSKLGLDGKYASSQAEAEEREKFKNIKKAKKAIEGFKKREQSAIQEFTRLLGPVAASTSTPLAKLKNTPNDTSVATKTRVLDQETKATEKNIVRIVRDQVDAGKRVISINDTEGNCLEDTIVLTQDLNSLESVMPANALQQPKSYPDDAENTVQEEDTTTTKMKSIYGLIKVFIANVHNCTILVKCKIISGTIEVHGCSNIRICIESGATVATLQVDLSKDLTVEFHNAPSGKNIPGTGKVLYWGDDKDDRIFHAGVSSMRVKVIRDGYIDAETMIDYERDGATAIGNTTAEEMQFVTSMLDGNLITEKVIRAGQSTGQNVRAMTEREIQQEQARRIQAEKMALDMAEDMIQIKDKNGNVLVSKKDKTEDGSTLPMGQTKGSVQEVIEEVYGSMSQADIAQIVDECMKNKTRGNEAFGNGEYAQAILLYSLALDKASELPDEKGSTAPILFPRDVIYSNRAACFLKMGQHDKAEQDARIAMEWNPSNIKALFRRGLALHALARYREALPFLAKANEIEPTNQQIKQAIQFCEVRLTQEERKRMEG